MRKIQGIVFSTVDDFRSILPRLIVGLVFLSEAGEIKNHPLAEGTKISTMAELTQWDVDSDKGINCTAEHEGVRQWLVENDML